MKHGLSLPQEILSFLTGKTVVCGFSGGSDSLALLLLLSESAEAFSFSLSALHFEHGIRGEESLADAEFCETFCKRRNIPFRCVSLDVPKNRLLREGEEAAARRLRFSIWKQYPSNTVIALAHHSGDAVENLMLRLMRGSNVSGLASFSMIDRTDGVQIVRPLLRESKHAIEEWLRERGESWRIDRTNLESEYGRNFLRNEILPPLYRKFPHAESGLRRTLQNLGEDAAYIEKEADRFFARITGKTEEWRQIPPALLSRVLRRFLCRETGQDRIPDRHLTERFADMIQSPPEHGCRQLETDDFRICIDRENVSIYRPPEKDILEWHWREQSVIDFNGWSFRAGDSEDCGDGRMQAAFALEQMPPVLILRCRKAGDRMTPFGTDGSVSVKKILEDAGICVPEKTNWPVLSLPDGRILWIPGIRRSALLPVSYRKIVFFVKKESSPIVK